MASIQSKMLRHFPKLMKAIPVLLAMHFFAERVGAWEESGGWTPEVAKVYETTQSAFERQMDGKLAIEQNLDVLEAWKKLFNKENLDDFNYFLHLHLMPKIVGGDSAPDLDPNMSPPSMNGGGNLYDWFWGLFN